MSPAITPAITDADLARLLGAATAAPAMPAGLADRIMAALPAAAAVPLLGCRRRLLFVRRVFGARRRSAAAGFAQRFYERNRLAIGSKKRNTVECVADKKSRVDSHISALFVS